MTEQELQNILKLDSAEILWEILSRLLPGSYTPWDVRFTTGKAPVRLRQIDRRGTLVQLWHNPKERYGEFPLQLGRRVLPGVQDLSGTWGEIAVAAAFLFAAGGRALQIGSVHSGEVWNLSLSGGDFFLTAGCVVAKRLGLPVGKIYCGCLENPYLWELLYHGSLKTGGMTNDPESAVPRGLEALLCLYGGGEASRRYLVSAHLGQEYEPDGETLQGLRRDMDISVLSRERVQRIISGARSSYGLALSRESALAYGAWQDFKPTEQGRNHCFVLSQTRN